jgi:hypothetical protein
MDDTTATIATTEFELIMARALCRQAIRGLDDHDDPCDLDAVFDSFDAGQKEIAATALRVLMDRLHAVHAEHHAREA